MKMRNLLLLAALVLMPLIACNANGTSSNAGDQAAPAAAPAKPDLGFLKKMGLDVSKLQAIDDSFDFEQEREFILLEEKADIFKLLPMVESMGEEIDAGYYIGGARALPGGKTMLLYSVEYGDGGTELMGIYDKNGNLVDFMQLGNCDEHMTIECNDDLTQGKAQITNTIMKFSSPDEFSIDKTIKVADWKRNKENGPTSFTKVHWLVQTLSTYEIDGQGRITLVDEKEIKRQGDIDPDYQRRNAIVNLGHLPASDPNRIERLSKMANELYKQLGRGEYDDDPSYYIQQVLAEYFDSNPQTLLQWIYTNRNKKNLIVEHFEQIFANGWRNKYTLVKAIEKMRDPDAQKYLEDLTAQWGPSDAVG